MRRVVIESPFAGDIRRNRGYARKALLDSLKRGEAPIASHLLYPQVLDEDNPSERTWGIEAGLAWAMTAEAAVFYADYGFSSGMLGAMRRFGEASIPVEVRYLFKRSGASAAQGQAIAPTEGDAPTGDPNAS